MMNDEQENAIYDVLWDYFISLKNGSKPNIYIHKLAETFPEIAKKAKAKIKSIK